MVGNRIVKEVKSIFNGNLRVVKTFGMGTYIQADGLTQSGGIVESIWKSVLKKVRRLEPDIHSSLILGLGGGSAAKLVKRYWTDAKIEGVDIDPLMIELGKKYLGLNTDNIKIKIDNAYDFIAKKSLRSAKYDFIIIDLYTGDRYPEKFATDKFVGLVKKSLLDNGIAVFNRLYYGDKRPETVKFGKTLEKSFSSVTWFYPEANLMFICRK